MVSVASGPLTRTAFRRDVRLFLSGLVGFLILLILLLLLFLRVDLDRTEKTIDHSEATIADVAADAVNGTPAANLPTQLVFFRSHHRRRRRGRGQRQAGGEPRSEEHTSE